MNIETSAYNLTSANALASYHLKLKMNFPYIKCWKFIFTPKELLTRLLFPEHFIGR